MLKYIKSIFNYHEHNKQLLIIVFLSFLATFSIARVYSLYFDYYIYINGYHIHHFYFGALALSIGGLIGILTTSKKMSRISAMFIGTGIGLFADEIGLLLNCTSNNRICAYYFPDTFDIIFAIALAIISTLILTDILDKKAQKKALDKDNENKTEQEE